MRTKIPYIAALAALVYAASGAWPGAWAGPPAKEYIPLYDRTFDPPLAGLSGLNPAGRLLAVQLGPDRRTPAKVIAIDQRGIAELVEDIGSVKEMTVPRERAWIAGLDAEEADGPGIRAPVTDTRVYLSKSGGGYTVVYKGPGSYYEVRHKDAHGGLRFVAAPRDGYGFKTVHLSGDGERVVVVDESPERGGAGGATGQRLYFYDGDGALLADHEMGPDPAEWLNASGGVLAADGGWFMAVRGREGGPGRSVAAYGGDGGLLWEKAFFAGHTLLEDLGGLVRVEGGSPALVSFIEASGALRTVKRMGYGFELWMGPARDRAYLVVFKPFDVARSGVAAEVEALAPGAKLAVVDPSALLPKGAKRPAICISPDGAAYIVYGRLELGGRAATALALYGPDGRKLWEERSYAGDVVPAFVGGGAFVLKVGQPAGRLIYYAPR